MTPASGAPAAKPPLPRLLYLADVPVGNTYAGGALLYRLFKPYPPERLLIVCPPLPESVRLPGVRYAIETDRWWPRLGRTRFSTLYALAMAWWRTWPRRRMEGLVEGFKPEAIITVAQSASWLGAAALARRHNLPLYLVTHDDGNFLAMFPPWSHAWADRRFGQTYRQATVRFCISPAMASLYARRYGAVGTVLFPSADPANAVFVDPAPQTGADRPTLVFAYAGSLHGEASLRQLAGLAIVIERLGHELLVHSPDHASFAQQVQARGLTRVRVEPPLPPDRILHHLRQHADVLLVTAGFAPAQRAATETLFHTKLADYAVIGLPVLLHAPAYAAVTLFFTEQADTVEVVTTGPEAAELVAAITRLQQPAHRRLLADRLLGLGRRIFSAEAAWGTLCTALATPTT